MATVADDESETVEVKLRAVGPSRPTTIRLPPLISVADLRRRVAQDRRLPEDRLRLVLRGTTLPWGEDDRVNLRDGDSLIVAVAPKPPAKHLRDDGDDDDDDEEELKFKIPQTTTWWKKRIFIFLRDKLRFPDILLMALFSVTMKAWIIITLWFLLAPIARKYEIGPLYYRNHPEHIRSLLNMHIEFCVVQARGIPGTRWEYRILATGFLIILLNLGRRQQGDISAYSIFNEDFREIPGTFNAERIDRDLRAGQL